MLRDIECKSAGRISSVVRNQPVPTANLWGIVSPPHSRSPCRRLHPQGLLDTVRPVYTKCPGTMSRTANVNCARSRMVDAVTTKPACSPCQPFRGRVTPQFSSPSLYLHLQRLLSAFGTVCELLCVTFIVAVNIDPRTPRDQPAAYTHRV